MKMTFFERLIRYFDFDKEDRVIVIIGNFLEEQWTEYESKFNPMYWFYFIPFIVFLVIVVLLPQVIAYSYYWTVALKYRHRIEMYDIDNVYDITDDIEKWCNDNDVEMFSLYKFFTQPPVLLFDQLHDDRHEFAFRSEEDLMAFKLMWL